MIPILEGNKFLSDGQPFFIGNKKYKAELFTLAFTDVYLYLDNSVTYDSVNKTYTLLFKGRWSGSESSKMDKVDYPDAILDIDIEITLTSKNINYLKQDIEEPFTVNCEDSRFKVVSVRSNKSDKSIKNWVDDNIRSNSQVYFYPI